jgi:hypothetical protein
VQAAGEGIALSATGPKSDESDFARDANEKRKYIARRSSGSTQNWADGGHAIPLVHPEAVTAGIRKILADAAPREQNTPLDARKLRKD